MIRTDIHRPSEIIAADYSYVAVWTMNIQDLGDAEFILREREIAKSHMARTGGQLQHFGNGSCSVCGNVLAIYLVLFYHAKTNTYITVGVDCAAKLDMGFDADAMKLFKRNVSNAREAQAGKRKAIAILSDLNLIDAWEISENYDTDTAKYEELTIRDIVCKLVKYGSISEKQSAFVAKLLTKIQQRPIIEAQRQAEREAAGPVPVGRVRMEGEVLSVKTVERNTYYYGDSGLDTKVLIKLANGSKVYGNRFANIERGDKIVFVATVEASKDDVKFGFFKRAKIQTESKQEAA